MVNHKVNQIVICQNNYDTKEEFECAVHKAIALLLENEYIMTIQQEEYGIIVIEYETEHIEWGCEYPYWLLPEEYELIESYNKYKEMKGEQNAANE